MEKCYLFDFFFSVSRLNLAEKLLHVAGFSMVFTANILHWHGGPFVHEDTVYFINVRHISQKVIQKISKILKWCLHYRKDLMYVIK